MSWLTLVSRKRATSLQSLLRHRQWRRLSESFQRKIWICQEVGKAFLKNWCLNCDFFKNGKNLGQRRGGRSSFKAEGTPYGKACGRRRPGRSERHLQTWEVTGLALLKAEWVFPPFSFCFSQGRNKGSQVVGTKFWATRFNSKKDIPRQDETAREKCYKNPGNRAECERTRAPPLLSATQTSKGALSGKVGDRAEKSSNLRKWFYCLPWKAQKTLLQCSSIPVRLTRRPN